MERDNIVMFKPRHTSKEPHGYGQDEIVEYMANSLEEAIVESKTENATIVCASLVYVTRDNVTGREQNYSAVIATLPSTLIGGLEFAKHRLLHGK